MSASTAPFTGLKRLLMVVAFCVFCLVLPLAFTRWSTAAEATIRELQHRSNTNESTLDLQQRNDATDAAHATDANDATPPPLQGSKVIEPTPTLKHQNLLGEYFPAELEKRGLLGPGGIMPGKVLPSILSQLNPSVVGALTSLAAAPLSTLIPAVPNIPNILPTVTAEGGAGIPLLPDLGGVALNPAGLATVADDAGDWMAAGISGILGGATALLPSNLPLATIVNDVVSQATAAADRVLSQVQNAAAAVATLAAQVETDALSPDGALVGAGSLLDNLESTIDNIVNDVVSDVADVVPLDLLDNVKSLVSGGLNSILDASNGPIAAVASVIDLNLCEAVKLVNGLLTTVTGVCGDMASVTSFSPTYSDTATATRAGTIPLNPTVSNSEPFSASAAQSITLPSVTSPAASQTGQLSTTLAQGSGSGPLNPTQAGNGPSQTKASGQNTNSNQGSVAGSGGSAPASGSGALQTAPTSSGGATQASSGSGPNSSNNGQSAPISSSGASQTAPIGGGGASPTTPGFGSSPSGDGQSAPNGASQTAPGGSGGLPGASGINSGQPIGGSGPSAPVTTAGGGISAVTVAVTITSTMTIANGAAPTQTVYMPGSTATTTATVSIYVPCPAQPPCPTCPPTSPPSGQIGNGPCPGSGYTCDDCVDGWFCPPSQTPAQSGPNGCFGWPCAHCSSGWFCIPKQSAGTCTSPGASGQLPNPGGPISPFPGQGSIVTIPSLPTGQIPSNTIAPKPANASPTIKNPANGWTYSGCWADQPFFAVLDYTPETSFGPIENEKCVRHCIVNGYTIAATSFGNKCFCGQFLNGTQKLDDSSCMTPCAGDTSQACGSNWSLLTYTPDGVPRGWAPVGEQPNPNPRPPPTIIELAYGGVEQSVVTQDIVVGPTSGLDIASLISAYGEQSAQPQVSLPSGVGPQTQCTTTPGGPSGASLTAPGSGKSSISSSNGNVSPTLPGGDNPSTSRSSPNGGGGVAPGQQTPTLPGINGPSPSPPSGQNPGPPGGIGPSTAGPGSGNPTTTPGGNTGPSSPGGNGASPSNTSTNGGLTATTGQQTPPTPGGVGSSPTLPGNGNPSTNPGGSVPSNPAGNPSNTFPNGGASPTLPGGSNPNTSSTSPNNGGGVAPGQQTPTSPGGIGPSPTLPGGGSSGTPSFPTSPGGQGSNPPPGGNSGGPTTPGISPNPTQTPGGNTPSFPSGPGGQGGSIPPGGAGGTPSTPGSNGGGSTPNGGPLPTCTPGSSGINCIPPLPPGAGISPTPPGASPFPPSGVPTGPAPSQPTNNSQGTISLPGVATPTNPDLSTTQSNSKGASLTAPGKQSTSSSSSTSGMPTGPNNGSGNPTSPGTLPTSPGGPNPGSPSSPTPGISPTPSSPDGTNPGSAGQGPTPGTSAGVSTPSSTSPGGIGPATSPALTTGPNGGSNTPGPTQTPTNPPQGGGLSSYSWPPGMVPYGDHPPFTTLAHMLSWKVPDESSGPVTLKRRVMTNAGEANTVE
ncbi:WSC domain-containing protein [Seiridium cupressi]